MKRFCLTRSLFLLSIALLYSLPASALVLEVDLQTNQIPGTEFTGIKTTVWTFPGGAFVATQSVPAYVGEDYITPMRVAEFDPLAGGSYEVQVELLDFAGTYVNQSKNDVVFQVNTHITAVISRSDAASPITKEALLIGDNDGSGDISAGDLVRYQVQSSEDSFDVFTDTPGVGSRLVAGSVALSHGVVTMGNTPGDTSVRVEDMMDGALPDEVKTIQFDVEVIPEMSNQGVGLLDNGERLRRVLTDDRDEPGDYDPTVTPISCSDTACETERERLEGELEMCEEDLGVAHDEIEALESEVEGLEGENSELRTQLAAATADADEDGVRDLDDQCAASTPGSAVDAAGCTQSQACSAIDASGAGAAMCRQYDWQNDEPLGMPNDCRVESRLCVAVP